jgi:hypothetical protein
LHPADRRASADLELFGRFTSRSPRFHELNHADSQVPSIRSPHWPTPPANQCVRLAPSAALGNPDSLRLGRAVVRKSRIGFELGRRRLARLSSPWRRYPANP